MLEREDLRKMLETAIVAARLAGQYAMEQLTYARPSIKNGTELVTEVDPKCQQIIIERIKEAFPDHGFIAEEGKGGGIFKQPPRGSPRIWWVIDPIDGTNNYAHKILLFTVSIAAMFDGQPVVGVIFEPATDSMFTAIKDSDAQLNGRRIEAGEENMNEFASVGLDSHMEDGVPPWALELMVRTRFRNLGSTALQFAYVAKRGLIATLTSWPKLWDIAAAAVICESAGAVVSKWNGEKIFPVDLEKYNGEKLQAFAANKKVYPQILELIKGK
jgi:myo-inositol-1(or 4)-monophosphatase